MKILSLFDGISCAYLALQRAGIPIEKYYACEVDKYAIQISKAMFPDIIHLGDVFNIGFQTLPKIDLLCGGSPCQDLSIAKADRKGLKGSKSSLFWEYVRVWQEHKPTYFLFENVASMKKEDRDIITRTFGVEPIMINSALVSAQQRKRLYWTNIKGIIQPEDKGILLKDILENDLTNRLKSFCIDANYAKGGNIKQYCLYHRQIFRPIKLGQIGNGAQGQRIYSVHGKTISLSANGGGQGAKTGLYKIDLPAGDYTVRKLTPRECCRLQTYDERCFEVAPQISNTQWYKCFGNGWTVDAIAHIFSFIGV